MSIVGPRPALPREVELYSDYQRQRLYVTPGLSCYWQIAPHRNEMSFDEWVALDLKYIQERSFWVDWKIIFLTVRAMLMKIWRVTKALLCGCTTGAFVTFISAPHPDLHW